MNQCRQKWKKYFKYSKLQKKHVSLKHLLISHCAKLFQMTQSFAKWVKRDVFEESHEIAVKNMVKSVR